MTRLKAAEPPGNPRRKALHWSPEIRRLWAEGYSAAQIRAALAAAGVNVSRATVWREAKRSGGPAGAWRARPTEKGRAVPNAANVASSQPDARPKDSGRARRGGAAVPERVEEAAPLKGAAPATPGPLGYGSGKAVAQRFAESHIANPLIRRKAKGQQG